METESGEMDRISELPEELIIHRILYFLVPWDALPVELVRMSVLSKKWFDLTASFPNLDFNMNRFRTRESFFKYVEYTTSRFCHQNLTANALTLVTNLREHAELDIVNRCLVLVLTNGVRYLDIRISNSSEKSPSAASANPMPRYRLPDLLLSVSVLKSLTLSGCELPSSLMVDVVKFKSLIHLTLDNVQIDDEAIKYLTTSCPLLQELYIRRCHGFKIFFVYGHHHLQKVEISYFSPPERIDIEAPNLSSLSIRDIGNRGAPQMNLALCKKLTTVNYYGDALPNDFLSNFPFIENFGLFTEYKCNNLNFSSRSLRTLVLDPGCDLEDIEFNTPKLVLFTYAYSHWPMLSDRRWPLLRDSTHLKGCMQLYSNRYIDALWFQKLRQFMYKKNGFKVLNLYIHANYSQKYTELKKLNMIDLPPYELEHVELQLETRGEASAHIAFVDAVLWCFRPRFLTLRSSFPIIDFDEQSDLVKFTHEKLHQQEDQGYTKIQIVSPSSSEAQKHLMDLKSSSMALYRARKTISFIKEEVVQEEADRKGMWI